MATPAGSSPFVPTTPSSTSLPPRPMRPLEAEVEGRAPPRGHEGLQPGPRRARGESPQCCPLNLASCDSSLIAFVRNQDNSIYQQHFSFYVSLQPLVLSTWGGGGGAARPRAPACYWELKGHVGEHAGCFPRPVHGAESGEVPGCAQAPVAPSLPPAAGRGARRLRLPSVELPPRKQPPGRAPHPRPLLPHTPQAPAPFHLLRARDLAMLPAHFHGPPFLCLPHGGPAPSGGCPRQRAGHHSGNSSRKEDR